jgi:hypothetical protein
MSFRDDWPKMPDGRDFDGRHLLTLVRSGNSPFQDKWDVNLLIQEIEENLGAQVVDIPFVSKGSNNYVGCGQDAMIDSIAHPMLTQRPVGWQKGIHLKLSNGMDIVARLARGDVNMPDYDGFPIHVQVPEVKFEAEVYALLQSEPDILASRLLYHRVPVQHEGPKLDRPKDIAGRRLLVFQRTEGEDNVWRALSPAQKVHTRK